MTSFYNFMKQCTLEQLRSYIEKPGTNINAKYQNEYSALYLACFNNDSDKINYLLEKGADPNIQNISGVTPLQTAAMRENLQIIKALIKKGADINLPNFTGETALDVGAGNGHLEIVEFLLEHGADIHIGYPITQAVWGENIKIVKLLVEKGGDINKKGVYGFYPLSTANLWYKEYPEIMHYLLEKGADVNIQNNFRITPLISAACDGYFDLVKLLLQKGADPKIANLSNKTAVDFAKTPEMKRYIQNYDKIKRGPELMALFQINSLPLELASLIADFDTPGTGPIGKKLFTDILYKRSENSFVYN